MGCGIADASSSFEPFYSAIGLVSWSGGREGNAQSTR
jgi:hypothetical protein